MLCINFISDDILTRIFSLLHPDDLLGVEVCSKRWKLCCKDDQVWSHHAIRVWDIITHNKPSEYVLIERVKKLSMIALKRALVRVDTNSCLEKIDYQKALVNRLVFRYRDMTTKSGIYRIQFPDWHRNFGDYKASYFYSKKETQRTTIHQSELCAIRWAFHFKHSDGPGLDEQYITTFYDDFTMDSQLHSQKLNWQVTFG